MKQCKDSLSGCLPTIRIQSYCQEQTHILVSNLFQKNRRFQHKKTQILSIVLEKRQNTILRGQYKLVHLAG